MKTYKSKVDWWLVLIILAVFGYPVVDGILSKEYMLSIVFCGILLLFYFLARTVRYKIEGEKLKIWYSTIDIKSIHKIYATRIPLSAPALSIDRLAIVYNKYDEVLLSPKNQDDFIQELLKVNPAIVVEV